MISLNSYAPILLLSGSLASLAAAQATQPMLFVTNWYSDDVSTFHVQADGELAPTAASPVGSDLGPALSALTPDGSFLLVVGYGPPSPVAGGALQGLAIGSDGSLTLGPSLTMTFDQGPIAMATASRDGRTFVYLFPIGPIVYAFELVQTGAEPTWQAVPGQPFASPGFIYFGDAAATPDGHYLYVVKAFDVGISGFAIAEDGSLTLLDMPGPAALDEFRAVTISPDGQHLYAATHGDVSGSQTAHIRAYSIGGDGLLDELPGSPYTSAPGNDRISDLALTPSGERLLTANYLSDTATVMMRNRDGTLAVLFQTDPIADQLIATAATDSHAFLLALSCSTCASFGSNVISLHIDDDRSLDASDGTPTGTAPTSLSLWLPTKITFVPSDLNHDGDVDGLDLATLLAAWGRCSEPADCAADLSGDGFVSGVDLAMLLSQWG